MGAMVKKLGFQSIGEIVKTMDEPSWSQKLKEALVPDKEDQAESSAGTKRASMQGRFKQCCDRFLGRYLGRRSKV